MPDEDAIQSANSSEQTPPAQDAPRSNEQGKLSTERKQRRPLQGQTRSKQIRNGIKQVAWRLTGIWCWLHFIVRFIWGRDVFCGFEGALVHELIKGLTTIGFSPGNQTILPSILKIGWLIAISGFSLLELVIVLPLYVITFPIDMLFLLIFHDTLKSQLNQNKTKPGLSPPRSKNAPLTTMGVTAFVGWFLLYGDSDSRLALLIGVLFAGGLFIIRIYAAFAYARPVEGLKSAFIEGCIRFSLQSAQEPLRKLNAGEFKNKIEIQISIKVDQIFYWIILRLTLMARGKRGKGRAALLVLLQYTSNLLLLGAVTILFWALVVRMVVLPESLPLTEALIVSASHVLPGLSPPPEVHISLWVEAFSSISAWILFVIYAGPAASVFPTLQQAYIDMIGGYYKMLRATAVVLKRHIKLLNDALIRP